MGRLGGRPVQSRFETWVRPVSVPRGNPGVRGMEGFCPKGTHTPSSNSLCLADAPPVIPTAIFV